MSASSLDSSDLEGNPGAHRRHAGAGLLLALGHILIAVSFPNSAVRELLIFAGAALGAVVLLRVRPSVLVWRLVAAAPLLLIVILLKDPRSSANPGPGIALKAITGILSLTALTTRFGESRLIAAAEGLGLPRSFGVATGLMIRTLGGLQDELTTMLRARRARGGDPRWLWQAASLGPMAGRLFVRSVERGETLSLAMQARGHGAPGRTERAERWTAGDALLVILGLGLGLAIRGSAL